MNQSLRDAEKLSPGNYSNVKYWTVKLSPEKLIIAAGNVPWKGIIIVETFVCGLSAVILFFAFTRGSQNLAVLVPLCVIFALTALGCFLLPVFQVRSERIKGDILVYDLNKEVLSLPRKRLVLRKSQVVEFSILQERRERRKRGGQFNISIAAPAELKLIYKNPNPKSVTLLRTSGVSFADVIEAIKQSKLSKIMLHEQEPEGLKWEVREI
jgi:hypothetical protein